MPFFLNWPAAIAGGKTYDHLVTALDIYPTVLAAAGADAGAMKRLDGKDLLPFINGANESPPHYQLFWRSVGGYEYAVHKGDFKLYKNASKEKTMLFNLAEDPGERHGLAAANPEMVAQLRTTWNADNIAPGWLDPHIENCIKDEQQWRKERNKSLRPMSKSGSQPTSR